MTGTVTISMDDYENLKKNRVLMSALTEMFQTKEDRVLLCQYFQPYGLDFLKAADEDIVGYCVQDCVARARYAGFTGVCL